MPPLVCGHCHYSQAWPEIRGCLDSLSAQACEMGAEIIVAAGDGRGLWFLLSLVWQLFQRILPLIMGSVVLGSPYFSAPPRPQEVLVSLLPSQAESELFSYNDSVCQELQSEH